VFRNRPDGLIGSADSFNIEVEIPLRNLPSLRQQTIGESKLKSLPFAHGVSSKLKMKVIRKDAQSLSAISPYSPMPLKPAK
jgi:hypothetical protein